MTNYPSFGCEDFIAQLHNEAQTSHGNLNLGIEACRSRLASITCKYLGDAPQKEKAISFLSSTHMNDLYLATACAEGIEIAWERFTQIYSGFIYRVANSVCSNPADADDLASSIIADPYVPDRSNRRRIASYDGQGPLARWLRAVIMHSAADRRDLKWNSVERLDDQPEIVDVQGVERMEAHLRASKYRPIILSTLKAVIERLTNRERYILVSIYGESMAAKEVAKMLGLHPSRVTQLLDQIRKKIRNEANTMLAEEHRLSQEAIDECLAEIVANPEYSLLSFIEEI